MITRLPVALCAIFVAASVARSAEQAPQDVDFVGVIKPLLSDRCFKCHGPDEANRAADLRLDQRDAIYGPSADSDEARIVVPGRPAASVLWQRISTDDADLRMPPGDSGVTLTAEEKQQIRRWIESGADWQEHWSFRAVVAPEVPTVRQQDWPANPIDRFVLSRLERAGFRPTVEADRQRLIRRVSFDLTGLPPTLDEIDGFLADQSPDAYEKVVDRLLESEAFGERMAADWLDAARYSDSYGYQVDRDRFVWPWRDWVVRAFNRNLPYDQFITEQLAGDLLPEAKADQILATTFNRLHPQKVEGGSVPEEFRIEYVADRTQTVGTAFLGLTLECSRCHDHKYDPILQRDYYSLFSFFDNIDEAGLYSYFTSSVPTPTLTLTTHAERTQLKQLQAEADKALDEWHRLQNDQAAQFREWLASKPQVDPEGLIPGLIEHLDFESKPGGGNSLVAGRFGQAVRLTGDDAVKLKQGNFPRWQPFSVSLWMQTPDVKDRAVVFHRSRAWTDAASRGYQLLIEDGCLSASLIHFWPGNAIRVRTRAPLPVGQWQHVVMTYDGSSTAAGLRLYVDGQLAEVQIVRDQLTKNITGGGGDTITIGERFRDRGFKGGLVDEFRVFDRQLVPIEVRQLFDGQSLAAALTAVRDGQSVGANVRDDLQVWYVANQSEPLRTALAELNEARQKHCEAQDALQEIMVMREQPAERTTYRLTRGAYDQPAEPVTSDTPAAVLPFDESWPRNRLGLARWMTDPANPLTSRVAVNRLWQLCFGTGLVRTPEDFGSQGALPTHPQLLDWMAADFMQHGWDVKRAMKQIVMSATYRQDSVPNPSNPADPENRLLARNHVFRLPAEMLRDNALAASGLLVRRVGGPPAKPYEVEASFKPTKRGTGDDLYRRSLYTYWKRTAPAPVMMTLDASKRDVCRVRRERTASPLQAFVVLNGPQFVEAARVMAQRAVHQHAGDERQQLVWLFRTLTSRHPTSDEAAVLNKLLKRQQSRFESNPQAAREFLAVGDHTVDDAAATPGLAALSVVASTLMNFDESIMRR